MPAPAHPACPPSEPCREHGNRRAGSIRRCARRDSLAMSTESLRLFHVPLAPVTSTSESSGSAESRRWIAVGLAGSTRSMARWRRTEGRVHACCSDDEAPDPSTSRCAGVVVAGRALDERDERAQRKRLQSSRGPRRAASRESTFARCTARPLHVGNSRHARRVFAHAARRLARRSTSAQFALNRSVARIAQI